MKRIIVLNYQEVFKGLNYGVNQRKNGIDEGTLWCHLNLIERLNIPILNPSDVGKGDFDSDVGILLTFVGGFKSDVELVVPLLKKRGYKAAFFPNYSSINTPNRLSDEELKEIAANGFDVGSQGLTNKDLMNLTRNECKLELELSKRLLEQKTGRRVWLFNGTFSSYNLRFLSLAYQAGYKNIFLSQNGFNSLGNRFSFNRLDVSKNLSLTQLRKVLMDGSHIPLLSRLRHWIFKGVGIGFLVKVNCFFQDVKALN